MFGGMKLRIATSYENGQIFQHFGKTKEFKIYNIEEDKIVSTEICDTNGSGHSALAGILVFNDVDVLICGGIGEGALSALLSVGIRVYPGVGGDSDTQVLKFLDGSLEFNPGASCSHEHHHEEKHECSGDCGGDCANCH